MESELSELWCAPKKLNDFLSRCDSMKIEFCKRAVQPTNEMMDIKGASGAVWALRSRVNVSRDGRVRKGIIEWLLAIK